MTQNTETRLGDRIRMPKRKETYTLSNHNEANITARIQNIELKYKIITNTKTENVDDPRTETRRHHDSNVIIKHFTV